MYMYLASYVVSDIHGTHSDCFCVHYELIT